MNGLVNRKAVVREKVINAVALLVLVLIGLLALIGPAGFLAWGEQSAQLEAHQERITALEKEREVLRNRVDLLDPDNVDEDYADELVRRDLGVAHKDDVVVELGDDN
ncbi:FtsB family cell division protein [Aurantiacibacter sediminis]|uniref:Septum formation initiator family protein n=1 Tax=Aurantiacibacter sediminis TaxID=2793064 RepID=A0ABS0N3Z4_9SPHN|nr:septum formation initiator family protein [Aurantiacibacter sediminis]MBH5322689.1 septum formation initiator family protein [Aurantiacibacter sediminis]